MSNRFPKVFLVILTGIFFLAAGSLTAADAPDDILLSMEAEGYTKKRGPVNLTHTKHVEDYKIACADCHHEYEDGKNVWKEGDPVKKCSECHLVRDPDQPAQEGDILHLQLAFHKNCRDCHKDMKKGPTNKCNDCHAPQPK